jgi:hypothetical protein
VKLPLPTGKVSTRDQQHIRTLDTVNLLNRTRRYTVQSDTYFGRVSELLSQLHHGVPKNLGVLAVVHNGGTLSRRC